MQLKSHKRHAVLECVPVDERQMEQAPGYFKKGMQVREHQPGCVCVCMHADVANGTGPWLLQGRHAGA